MRHTSGLTYGVMGNTAVHKLYPSISYDVPGLMSGSEFIDKLGTLPLLHQPGTHWDYGFSTDVLGLVIENVTKGTLGEFLKQNLFRPLGMADACFLLAPGQARRIREATSGRSRHRQEAIHSGVSPSLSSSSAAGPARLPLPATTSASPRCS